MEKVRGPVQRIHDPNVLISRMASALLAENAVTEEELDRSKMEIIIHTVEAIYLSELWHRLTASSQRLAEVPFEVKLSAKEAESLTGSARETILKGVIDLAFREDDGWVLVDYKTDVGDPEKLAREYGPQVKLYSDCWEKITGEPVKEGGIFLTRSQTYQVV